MVILIFALYFSELGLCSPCFPLMERKWYRREDVALAWGIAGGFMTSSVFFFNNDIPYLKQCAILGLIINSVLGALYPDGTSGAQKKDDGVPPGGNHTYTWTVKPEFAPAQGDSNCLTWAYHSHVIANKDISSGLIGALLTCKKGTDVSHPIMEYAHCTHPSFPFIYSICPHMTAGGYTIYAICAALFALVLHLI